MNQTHPRFGALASVHRPEPRSDARTIGVALFAVLFGLIGVIGVVSALLHASWGDALFYASYPVISCAVIGVLVWLARLRSKCATTFYAHGLTHQGMFRAREIAFDEIRMTEITRGGGTGDSLLIVLRRGGEICISHLDDAAPLARFLGDARRAS
ncbi:MAG: hypothetical protein M3Y87_02510 [Myxococcota bacterium]|nr:hypothetical protein [Myxococcota bacterium]